MKGTLVMDSSIRPTSARGPLRPPVPGGRRRKEGGASFEEELEKQGEEAPFHAEAAAEAQPESHKPTDDESGSILDVTG